MSATHTFTTEQMQQLRELTNELRKSLQVQSEYAAQISPKFAKKAMFLEAEEGVRVFLSSKMKETDVKSFIYQFERVFVQDLSQLNAEKIADMTSNEDKQPLADAINQSIQLLNAMALLFKEGKWWRIENPLKDLIKGMKAYHKIWMPKAKSLKKENWSFMRWLKGLFG